MNDGVGGFKRCSGKEFLKVGDVRKNIYIYTGCHQGRFDSSRGPGGMERLDIGCSPRCMGARHGCAGNYVV